MHTAIHMLALLLQQAPTTFRDTVYTKQVGVGVIQQIGILSGAVMTVAVFLLTVTIFLLVWYCRGIYRSVSRLIDHVEREVVPLVRGASGLTEDLRDIVTSVKGDARQVEETIATVNARARDVARRVEERIRRFESLLDVVEEEAEATVVTAAAAVRGVRSGIQAIFDHFDHREGDDDGDSGDDGYAGTTYGRPTRPGARPRRNDDGDGFV